MEPGSDDLADGGLFGGQRLYQQLDRRGPAAGSLLVAAPDMTDPNFQRAVIYLVEHDSAGSLGVVLTRRSETPVDEILPAWAPLCSRPADFFIGGPVKPDTGIALAVLRAGVDAQTSPGVQRIEGRVHVVDLDGDPHQVADMVEGMRLFVGYSGWGPGQLEAELARGDWYVTPGLPGDLLAPAHVDVWGQVLRRQPMPLPLYATYVDDGEVN